MAGALIILIIKALQFCFLMVISLESVDVEFKELKTGGGAITSGKFKWGIAIICTSKYGSCKTATQTLKSSMKQYDDDITFYILHMQYLSLNN